MKNLYIVSISILFAGLTGCSNGIVLPEGASSMSTGIVLQRGDGSYIWRLSTHRQTTESSDLLKVMVEKSEKFCEKNGKKFVLDKEVHFNEGQQAVVWPFAKIYFRCE